MSKTILKGRVFDSTGRDVLENGIVIYEGNKITYVGEDCGNLYNAQDKIIEIGECTIFPGFIDGHTHFGCGSDNVGTWYLTNTQEKSLLALKELEACLNAGFTGVREVGGDTHLLSAPIVKYGYKSPRICSSGRYISQLNGHGDLHNKYPSEMVELAGISTLANGVDECITKAREQIRNGAKFIKTGISGGGTSEGDSLEASEYTNAELQALVEVANVAGTYVAVHAHARIGIKRAIENGIKCIEHGTYIDDECIELAVKNGTYVVPTFSVGASYLDHFDKMPPFVQEKVRQLGDPARGLNMLEAAGERHNKAFKAGVKYGFGSDLLGSDGAPYGKNGREFELMVKYIGMTPAEVIIAATKTNSELMLMADKIGTLEVGKLADIVIVKGNPLEDITLLSNPDNVKVVIKDGVIEKYID